MSTEFGRLQKFGPCLTSEWETHDSSRESSFRIGELP